VEGDALEIIQALRRDSICRGSYGHLVDGAKDILNSVGHWEATHVRRSGNEAAHILAKFALNFDIEHSWSLECPPCI
jgi:hypothetical protein